MRFSRDQRGFVLSGIALLLILPAMLVAAYGLRAIELGGESASVQVMADKVSYAGRNIASTIEFMQSNKVPITDEVLCSLAENSSAATGLLVDISSEWVFPIWIHVQNTGVNHYAGTRYCFIESLGPGEWHYSFEDLDVWLGQLVDFDYDEPILLVEELPGGLNITALTYNGSYHSDVYFSDALLWSGVGGTDHAHIGENKTISENLFSLFRTVGIEVRDPRNLARYVENIALT